MSGFALSSRLPMLGAVMAAFGAIAAAPTENGTDRPGGVYSYIPTEDAAACAIACAQDKICLAWSFKATEFVGCALKAIVPPQSADPQIESGIASRASEFLSLTSLSRPAPAESKPAATPPPEKPRPMAELPAPTEAAFEPIAPLAFTSYALATFDFVAASAPSPMRVSLSAANAIVEEEFAGAAPESFLRTASLKAPEAIAIPSLAPLRQVALSAPALILEEEFAGAAPQSFIHVSSLPAAPLAPATRPLPALTPTLLTQRDFVFEEEFEGAAPLARFTLVSTPSRPQVEAPPALTDPWLMTAPLLYAEAEPTIAPPQNLAQMAVVPRPMIFTVAAETPAPLANTQTAALEEDLLGGPDKP